MVYTVPKNDFSSTTVAMGSCLAFDGASTTYIPRKIRVTWYSVRKRIQQEAKSRPTICMAHEPNTSTITPFLPSEAVLSTPPSTSPFPPSPKGTQTLAIPSTPSSTNPLKSPNSPPRSPSTNPTVSAKVSPLFSNHSPPARPAT